LALRPEILTFDCYGTLIDWESGISGAFRSLLARSRSTPKVDVAKLFKLYEEEEKRVEKEEYRPYREVLAETASRVARRTGWELPLEDAGFFADDLPSWKPFEETNPALRRLSRNCELGILSNVDEDLLAGTLKHLAVPFDLIVTAEQVRSYKPGRAHFEKAKEIIGGSAWVHVAGSLYHDIEPALGLGISAVWVNRKAQRAPPNISSRMISVKNLAELATSLGV
jgi:2-haloalkanoic acid dehalogenase type II